VLAAGTPPQVSLQVLKQSEKLECKRSACTGMSGSEV